MARPHASSAVTLSLLCCLAACGGTSSPTPTSPSPPSAPSSPAPTPTPPSTCRAFSTPGSYTLDTDAGVPGNTSDCLTIMTSGVSIDCAQHVVNGIVTIFSGTSDVTIRNCVIPGGFRNPGDVTNLTIADSTISNIVLVTGGKNTIIRGNHISITGRPGAIVSFISGSGNQVLGNVLDGGYHGHDLTGQGKDTMTGVDDGIVLENETGDTVAGNTITNVFDAGIEGVDAVTSTMISENTITNAVFAGISSYWCTHWQGNTISGNTVSQAVQAIQVTYSTGSLCGVTPASGLFVGNTIAQNNFRDPLGTATAGVGVYLPSISRTVTDNVVRGNDVGDRGISFDPLSGFTNGGGNICGPSGNFGC